VTEEAVPETVPNEPKDLVVVATNATQMAVAQKNLVVWAEEKVNALIAERDEQQQNLDIAKKRKWRITPFQRLVTRLGARVEFYEKIKAALEAGYTIVPNFAEIDVFAMRTTRQRPRVNSVTSDPLWTTQPQNQTTNRPALGEGRFVNTEAITARRYHVKRDDKGLETKQVTLWASSFSAVDFPFRLVKPEILEQTAQAMERLCFDDVGILPHRKQRRGDPMILGRIHLKEGASTKTVSFLITWFVDTRAL
jgi:hypothetical protein